ncbi:slipin family protein [bacterium]|nr:slipin family protein [bacterium]MCB1221641.1 slipin family protein [bacterium]UNM10051.1 MAG: slipin family protein [Planctomycetales bacterium]
MTYVHIPQTGGGIQSATSESGKIHPIAVFWFILLLLGSVVGLVTGLALGAIAFGIVAFVVLFILSMIMLTCLKVADQWDHVIVLKLGKYHATYKAGMFFLVPFVDQVAKWIDTRVKTADLLAEETLTKDTVPVDVDAVMFWLVYDAKKAALEVEKLEESVTWAAQTALRDLIGKTQLAELLVGRDVLDAQLQEIIDGRTEPWGVTVQSVEIREIRIPQNLQDSMSRQAQAERERQARVILGESEKQIAKSFAEAAEQYADNPTALHLRAMNMLFEGLKEKGSLMIVPSSAIDSMNLGGLSGMASMGMQHHANVTNNPPQGGKG